LKTPEPARDYSVSSTIFELPASTNIRLFDRLGATSPKVFSIIKWAAMFFSLRRNAAKTQISTQNISILEEEIKALETQIYKSQEMLEKANQPLNKERILRNELLMQKEGEYVVDGADGTWEFANHLFTITKPSSKILRSLSDTSSLLSRIKILRYKSIISVPNRHCAIGSSPLL